MTYRCDDCGQMSDTPGYCESCLQTHRVCAAYVSTINAEAPRIAPEPRSTLTAEEWLRDYRKITLNMLESERTLTWNDYRKTSKHRREVRLALLRGETDVDLEALDPSFYQGAV